MKSPSILVTCVLLTSVTASAQEDLHGLGLQASTPATSGRKAAPMALQGLSIVLVLGDLQSGTSSDNMPAAARAALADMKDFLPYKSYRLLDSAWILSSNSRPSTSRLRGPDDQDYEVLLTAGVFGPTVQIKFHLREPGAGSRDAAEFRRQLVSTELANLQSQRQSLDGELKAAREKVGPLHPDIQRREADLADVRRRIAELEAKSSASGAAIIIDTGFTMDIGETVVVGTSRVRGDKALIALLTAVPRTR